MELIVLIGGVLGVLIFLIMTVLSFWSWRWYQPIAMALVMFATIPFLYYGARVTKTRVAWMKVHDRFETNLAKAEVRLEQLEQGTDASGVKVNQTLAELQTEVVGLSYDRGRVWAGSIPQEVTLPTIRLQLPASPPPAEGGAAPVNSLSQNLIVYLFKETTTPSGLRLPYFYLGEWRVTDANGPNVTLETTAPLDGAQVRQLNERTDLQGQPATWAVFEIMPVDNRELLSDPEYLAGPIEQQFPITEDRLRQILPKALYGPDLTDAQYADTIAKLSRQMRIDYLYDGKPIEEIKAQFPDFDPDDSLIRVEVKFTKEKTFEVDADQATNPIDRPAYNTEGLAIVPVLKAAEGTVTFKAGDTASLPKTLVDELIAEGVVDPNYDASAVTYARPLRDYEFLFGDTLFFLDQIEESIANAQQKTAELTNALTSLIGDMAAPDAEGGQIALRQEERSRLQQDLAAVTRELEIVTERHAELLARWEAKRSLMSSLYRSNNELVQELRRLQLEQAERIESRTVSLAP